MVPRVQYIMNVQIEKKMYTFPDGQSPLRMQYKIDRLLIQQATISTKIITKKTRSEHSRTLKEADQKLISLNIIFEKLLP